MTYLNENNPIFSTLTKHAVVCISTVFLFIAYSIAHPSYALDIQDNENVRVILEGTLLFDGEFYSLRFKNKVRCISGDTVEVWMRLALEKLQRRLGITDF